MKKTLLRGLCLLMLCVLLSGCGFTLDQVKMPPMPTMPGGSSTLEAKVLSVAGHDCVAQVTAEDSHFKEETTLNIHFTEAEGSISVGKTLVVTYVYTADVSVKDSMPLITVETVTVQ